MSDNRENLITAVVEKILSELDFNIAACLFRYNHCLNHKANEIRMNVTMPVSLPTELLVDVEKELCRRGGWDDCKIAAYFLPMYMPSVDRYDSQRNEVETKLQILDVRLYTEYLIQGVSDK